MTHNDTRIDAATRSDAGLRATGLWLALAAFLLALALAFHGPLSPDLGIQMKRIADGSLRWAVVHWAAAAALLFFATAGLIALASGSRLTQRWWTLSAWAVLPIGALCTMSTAVAEATVIFNAALAGNRAVFDTWWGFAEGMANGFPAMALAFTVIAGNEARTSDTTPVWASALAAAAGAVSFVGWALGSWLGLVIGGPIWVASSLLVCLWLLWFGLALTRKAIAHAPGRSGATFRA